jgi:hypothetical protein
METESRGAAAPRASVTDQLGRQLTPESHERRQRQLVQPSIRATLIGSDRCEAEGIVAHAYAPALAVCRKLVEAGYDPRTPLVAWRGAVPCLHIRTIGEGAQLTVEDDRRGTPRLRRRRKRSPGDGAGAPVAHSAQRWGMPLPDQQAKREAAP